MESKSDELQKLSLKVAELSSELEKQHALRAANTKWVVIVGSMILAALGFTNLIQIPREAEKAAREQVGPEIIKKAEETVSQITDKNRDAQEILDKLNVREKNAIGGSGTIAFFDRPNCPDGWEEFKEGSGRFLIASGDGYNYLSKGGQKEVALSIAQMATHSHKATGRTSKGFTEAASTWRGGGSPGPKPTYVGNASESKVDITMEPTGEGKPHDNMPPYLTLTLCRKR